MHLRDRTMQVLECFKPLWCQGSQCTPQYDYLQEVSHGAFVPSRFLPLALPPQYHACKLIHKVADTWSFFFSQRKWLHSWSSVSTTSGTEVLLIWLKGTLPTNSHDIIAYRIFLKLQSVFLLLLEEQNSSLLYSPDLDTVNLLIVKSGSQTATNLPRSLSLASSSLLPSVPAPGWWRGGGSVDQRTPGCWH